MGDLARSRRLRTLVWDTEALRSKGDLEWGAYRKVAGVSVGCTIDADTGIPRFYTCGERDEYSVVNMARDLEEASTVITYNGTGYDIEVLGNSVGRKIDLHKHVDVYEVLKIEMRKQGRAWPEGGMRLGAVCDRTLGFGKSDDGPRAPELWREGQVGRLLTYCYNDVFILWRLWRFARLYGYVLDPSGKRLEVSGL